MGCVATLLVVSIHFHLKPASGTLISLIWSASGIGIAQVAVPFFLFQNGAKSGKSAWRLTSLLPHISLTGQRISRSEEELGNTMENHFARRMKDPEPIHRLFEKEKVRYVAD